MIVVAVVVVVVAAAGEVLGNAVGGVAVVSMAVVGVTDPTRYTGGCHTVGRIPTSTTTTASATHGRP